MDAGLVWLMEQCWSTFQELYREKRLPSQTYVHFGLTLSERCWFNTPVVSWDMRLIHSSNHFAQPLNFFLLQAMKWDFEVGNLSKRVFTFFSFCLIFLLNLSDDCRGDQGSSAKSVGFFEAHRGWFETGKAEHHILPRVVKEHPAQRFCFSAFCLTSPLSFVRFHSCKL